MRGRTRFDPDQAGWQLAKILQNPRATDALADHHRARIIDPVHLEYRLPNIHTNRANLAHGRLPSMWFALTQPPYGTSMPQSGRRPQHHKQTFRKVRPMSALPRRIQPVRATPSNLLRGEEVRDGDVTDLVHSSAEGRAVGAMEARTKCGGHLSGAGKEEQDRC